MKNTLYLTGIAILAAGLLALLLGFREFYAALLICAGSLIGTIGGGWDRTKKEQISSVAFMVFMSGLMLVHPFEEEGPGMLSGIRIPWIGIPLLVAIVALAILRVRGQRQKPHPDASSRQF